jgi:signal transduction histidine kinase
MIRIAVNDDGEGISNVHGLSAFKMFSQLNNSFIYTDSKMQYGTGMGLYVVSNIINMLDGDFKIQSKQDGHEMTSFEFCLPYKDPGKDILQVSLLDQS